MPGFEQQPPIGVHMERQTSPDFTEGDMLTAVTIFEGQKILDPIRTPNIWHRLVMSARNNQILKSAETIKDIPVGIKNALEKLIAEQAEADELSRDIHAAIKAETLSYEDAWYEDLKLHPEKIAQLPKDDRDIYYKWFEDNGF